MILPFSTQINGQKSLFVEKIWEGILRREEFDNIADEYQYYRCLYRTQFGSNWDGYPEEQTGRMNPKIHTLRVDLHHRWQAGKLIHFVINNRSKNFFQFMPIIPCISTQIVLIVENQKDSIDIEIDGSWIDSQEQKELFAKNDGFDDFAGFEQYFKSQMRKHKTDSAILKLIHWTNYKY